MMIFVAIIETMTDDHCFDDHFCNYYIYVFYDVVITIMTPVVIVPVIAPVIVTITGGHYNNDRLSLYKSLH